MVRVLIAGCHAPLSRKKLRQLMPGNHKNLTGSRLADSHKRSPGAGRFKCRLQDRAMELERRSQDAADNLTLREKLTIALSAINSLILPRGQSRRVVKASRDK